MAISAIYLKNLTQNTLAISGIFHRTQQVQLNIAVGAQKDVSGAVSLADLNRSVEIQGLIARGSLQVVPTPGTQGVTGDVVGMPGVPDAFGREVAVAQHFNVTAGAGGAPDDVTVYATSPRMRILDAAFIVTTAVGGSTVTLRTATGGGGSAVSDAFNTATTGYKRNTAITASQLLTVGSTLVLRRSDSGVAGELLLFVELS